MKLVRVCVCVCVGGECGWRDSEDSEGGGRHVNEDDGVSVSVHMWAE